MFSDFSATVQMHLYKIYNTVCIFDSISFFFFSRSALFLRPPPVAGGRSILQLLILHNIKQYASCIVSCLFSQKSTQISERPETIPNVVNSFLLTTRKDLYGNFSGLYTQRWDCWVTNMGILNLSTYWQDGWTGLLSH